jgi:hypothetical protein
MGTLLLQSWDCDVMKRVRRARLEDRSWGAVNGALDAASSPMAPALVDAADSAEAAAAGDDDATATSGGLLVDDPRVLHAFRCGSSAQSRADRSRADRIAVRAVAGVSGSTRTRRGHGTGMG